MHTEAKIDLDGRKATLHQQDKTLTAFIVEPETAKFELADFNPPPPDGHQTVSKLLVKLPVPASPTRLAVIFTPGDSPSADPITPLANWQTPR
jgi:hypothetical protein